jgi:hypothetical protein
MLHGLPGDMSTKNIKGAGSVKMVVYGAIVPCTNLVTGSEETALKYFGNKRILNILLEFYRWLWVGLSDGMMTELPDSTPNAYAILENYAFCYLSCEHHIFEFECPRDSGEAIRPEWKPNGNIIGCGLLLYLNDKLSIFFTVNGKLMGLFIRN